MRRKVARAAVFSVLCIAMLPRPARAGLLDLFRTRASVEAKAGMKAYGAEDWSEAMTRFSIAREQAKEPGVLDYDLGTAAYRNGDPETALKSFSAAERSGDVPPGEAAYNLGNALSRAKQLKEALAAYRAALRDNPDNEDARYNYEVTQRQLDQQQSKPDDKDQKQQKNPKDKKKGEEGNQDGKNKPSDQAPPDSTGSGRQNPSQGEGQQPQASQEQQDQSGEQGKKGKAGAQGQRMDKAEAERLLNALSGEEKDLLRARLKAGKRRKAEKDW